MEIKKAAKTGNKQATTVLAKQLIQLRKQKTRTFTAQSQIRGAKNQAHAMGANAKLAETMVTFMCPSAKLIWVSTKGWSLTPSWFETANFRTVQKI